MTSKLRTLMFALMFAVLFGVPCAYANDTTGTADDLAATEASEPIVLSACAELDAGDFSLGAAGMPIDDPAGSEDRVSLGSVDGSNPLDGDLAACSETRLYDAILKRNGELIIRNAESSNMESGMPYGRSLQFPLVPEGDIRGVSGSEEGSIAEFRGMSEEIDGVESAPWYESRYLVTRVSFEEDVAPHTMAHWFMGLQNLRSVDFSGLDSSHVLSMRSLFDGCTSLSSFEADGLNTSQVTDMSRMFANCSSLLSLDLSSLDTRNVKNTEGMLEGCSSLTTVNVSSFSQALISTMSSGDGSSSAVRSIVEMSASATRSVLFAGDGEIQPTIENLASALLDESGFSSSREMDQRVFPVAFGSPGGPIGSFKIEETVIPKVISSVSEYALDMVQSPNSVSRPNPMTPIGLSVGFLSTLILLVIMVPTTLLILRDRSNK